MRCVTYLAYQLVCRLRCAVLPVRAVRCWLSGGRPLAVLMSSGGRSPVHRCGLCTRQQPISAPFAGGTLTGPARLHSATRTPARAASTGCAPVSHRMAGLREVLPDANP